MRLTDLAGEGVVLHLGDRRYFTVNATGLTILKAMDLPCTLDDMIAAVLQEFEVSPDVAERTTREFLDHCLAANVVSVEPA